MKNKGTDQTWIIIIIIIKILFKEEAQLDVHPIFPGVLMDVNKDHVPSGISSRFNFLMTRLIFQIY